MGAPVVGVARNMPLAAVTAAAASPGYRPPPRPSRFRVARSRGSFGRKGTLCLWGMLRQPRKNLAPRRSSGCCAQRGLQLRPFQVMQVVPKRGCLRIWIWMRTSLRGCDKWVVALETAWPRERAAEKIKELLWRNRTTLTNALSAAMSGSLMGRTMCWDWSGRSVPFVVSCSWHMLLPSRTRRTWLRQSQGQLQGWWRWTCTGTSVAK
mmetsp:Transcript_50238/g.126608  ORF Transcript_50238/g.126608 Transcript_50238/m.126608 type:complete len:208 (+) Transcript_50238:248-871(+)